MRHKIFLISSLILILSIIIFFNAAMPTASANNLWDWLTGKATNPTNLSIVVSQITVDWVSAIPTPQNVTEKGSTNVTFYFTASIPSGDVSNINDTSARANFTKGSEETRENLSCALVGDVDSDTANYSCVISFWYWDGAGTWTVTAAIADNNGNWALNNSNTFNIAESTCFVVSPSALTWPTVIPGAVNQQSNNDPSLLNNTCNDDIASGGVGVKALDLLGETSSSKSILATEFKSHTATGGAECTAGTALVNNTYQSVSGSILTAGNNSKNYQNETSGQEQLYYCIPLVNAALSAQTYSTTKLGSWTIQIS